MLLKLAMNRAVARIEDMLCEKQAQGLHPIEQLRRQRQFARERQRLQDQIRQQYYARMSEDPERYATDPRQQLMKELQGEYYDRLRTSYDKYMGEPSATQDNDDAPKVLTPPK